MTKNMEKAKVLNAFFALVFTGKICHQEFQLPETPGKAWRKEGLPLVQEDQARKYLNWTYTSRCDLMRMHPWVFRELAHVITRLLLLAFERPWSLRCGLLPSSRRIQQTTGQSASPFLRKRWSKHIKEKVIGSHCINLQNGNHA